MPIHHFNFSSWFCTSIWKSLLTHILQSFSHLQNDKCENSLEATNISSLAWHMLYDIWKFCVYKLSEHFWATSPFWLEKEMATHSSVLAWRIPETREPGGLLSMGSHRVGHDWSDLAAAAAALPGINQEIYMPVIGKHWCGSRSAMQAEIEGKKLWERLY